MTSTAPIRTAGLACVVLAAAASAQPVWNLVFEDGFNGTTLNTDVWEPMIGTGTLYGLPAGWGNNELQYYTDRPENITVLGGNAIFTIRRENFAGRDFTSARLRTRGNVFTQYGRIEARIRIPTGDGMWPAFWMLPEDGRYGGWAASGELDVMECVNQADRIAGTIHFGGQWPNNTASGGALTAQTHIGSGLFSDTFHTYAVEWEPGRIRWYVDDRLYSTKTANQWFSANAPGNDRAPFDQPMHLLLNCAVGGNFPNRAPQPSFTSTTMLVDYVRVFERVRAPFLGRPAVIPGPIEAENFDDGHDDDTYADCTPQNQGGAYRSTGVDIEQSTVFGFNIAYMCPGEWLEYTVDVVRGGRYRVDALVASQSEGGLFNLTSDGVPITAAPVIVPVTGGWQTWTTVSTTVELDEGLHVIRFENADAAGLEFNLNRFEFTPLCLADIAPAYGSLDVNDIIDFVNGFASGAAVADIAPTAAGDGMLNVNDVITFVNAFNAGCP